MVAAAADGLGAIDILVNNVAISDNRHFLEITEEEWRRTIDVTLSSPFFVSREVAKWMIANDRTGKILNIGSTSGFKGRLTAIAYTAAKGGVFNLTQSMAVQLAPYGIVVNQISPNMTGSPVGQGGVQPKPGRLQPRRARRPAAGNRQGRGLHGVGRRVVRRRRQPIRRRRHDGDGLVREARRTPGRKADARTGK